jgi:hypothetical protein
LVVLLPYDGVVVDAGGDDMVELEFVVVLELLLLDGVLLEFDGVLLELDGMLLEDDDGFSAVRHSVLRCVSVVVVVLDG